MRRNVINWMIKPAIAVFLFQELIFVREYIQDYARYSHVPESINFVPDVPADDMQPIPEMQRSTTKEPAASQSDVIKQINQMSESLKVRKQGIDCAKIIQGDGKQITRAALLTTHNVTMPSSNFAMVMQFKHSCTKFIHDKGYILHHMTEEERNFPIAYSLLVYQKFHQVESTMRLIYRPQNFYCIHVDHRAKTHMQIAAKNFADCFPNVVVPRDLIRVTKGDITTINAEVVCMYEMLKYKWNYYISLSEHDFPMKTNRQIVQILTALQGANDVQTKPMKLQGDSYKIRFKEKVTAPHGIKVTRGSGHIVVSRRFVEFLTSNDRVRDFITYLNGTRSPAETFWTTVNNDPAFKAPGGFGGTFEMASTKPWIGRYRKERPNPTCRTRYHGDACVFGVTDVKDITQGKQMFANKIMSNFQPIAFRCLREWMVNRTRDEYLDKYKFDSSYYSTLPQVLKRRRT